MSFFINHSNLRFLCNLRFYFTLKISIWSWKIQNLCLYAYRSLIFTSLNCHGRILNLPLRLCKTNLFFLRKYSPFHLASKRSVCCKIKSRILPQNQEYYPESQSMKATVRVVIPTSNQQPKVTNFFYSGLCYIRELVK